VFGIFDGRIHLLRELEEAFAAVEADAGSLQVAPAHFGPEHAGELLLAIEDVSLPLEVARRPRRGCGANRKQAGAPKHDSEDARIPSHSKNLVGFGGPEV
jgi:hypothetical protein